jgi:hypothetical protein
VVARINMLLNALYALVITPDNANEDYVRHRLVSESIVSAISGIASILKDDKVCMLTTIEWCKLVVDISTIYVSGDSILSIHSFTSSG